VEGVRQEQEVAVTGKSSSAPRAARPERSLLPRARQHPPARSSAIPLPLRAVGGLTTAEIAHAFLLREATFAQRISRAKQTIKTSGVPFAIPSGGEREAWLASVLHVLYLVLNEGSTGERR
jgi:predicted RNA polymerase sigma factor